MKKALFLLLMITALWQCDTSENPARDEVYQTLDTLDRDNPNEVELAENRLRAYVLEHPDDTSNPRFLFEAAQLNINPLQDYRDAISLFEKVATDYPQHGLAPQALFTTGFIYEQYLQNPVKANEQYKLVIERYPDNYWAQQAQGNMSLPDDESIMKMLDSIQKQKEIM